jgi:hypothetical protein
MIIARTHGGCQVVNKSYSMVAAAGLGVMHGFAQYISSPQGFATIAEGFSPAASVWRPRKPPG